jgi:hypothetical protein
MSATLARVGVPPEFTGRARQLRDAIAGEDRATGELTRALSERLLSRYRRGNHVPRRDVLCGVADEWRRTLPPRSRLAIEVDLNARRKSLAIKEMRVTTSRYQPETWATAEKGLIVGLTMLEVWPLHCHFDVFSLAHVGLHGLARRLQRGVDGSEAAVMDDLRALGQAHHGLADLPAGSEFRVSLDHGGVWVGTVEPVLDPRIGYDRALAVRTYMIDGI